MILQTWRMNMSEHEEALIEEIPEGTPDFTKVTFKPDLEKLHMTRLDEAAVGLMERRVVDVAGTLKGVRVYLNGEKIDVWFRLICYIRMIIHIAALIFIINLYMEG